MQDGSLYHCDAIIRIEPSSIALEQYQRPTTMQTPYLQQVGTANRISCLEKARNHFSPLDMVRFWKSLGF